MTIQELNQLYHLTREIKDIQRKIEELRSIAEKTTQTISDMPRGSSVSDKVGGSAVLIADYTTMLSDALAERLKEQKKLHDYIMSVPDALLRRMMTYRFIDGCTWGMVASRIGGYNDANGVRMMIHRYLEKENRHQCEKDEEQ